MEIDAETATSAEIGEHTDRLVAEVVGAPHEQFDDLPPSLRFTRNAVASSMLIDWISAAVPYETEDNPFTAAIPCKFVPGGREGEGEQTEVCRYDPHVEDGAIVDRGHVFGRCRTHARARMALLLAARGLIGGGEA